MTPLDPAHLAAMTVAVCFAAGLNVYATAMTLGLLAQADLVALPAPIGLLEDWWVIGATAALFTVEFFADKIPVFDLVWNVLQTFVRVPAGALLAWSATMTLSPAAQATAAIAGGLIALAAHGGKLAVRGAVTASPEPFSNALLSFGEDVAAVALTWFATTYPYLAAAIALAALAAIVVFVRWAIVAITSLARRGQAWAAPGRSDGRLDR